jgi:hypothetical protein
MNAILLAAIVIVQTPTIRLVPLQTVHNACGAAGEYDACTRFVAYRLDAVCTGGRVRATVTFRPLIFLYDIHQMTHEKLHIEDIRRFADAYVTDIEQKAFETDSQCCAEMFSAIGNFDATMRAFAERSNLERHPELRR